MHTSEATLYDKFARARQEAVKLSDRYLDAPSDAPYRDELWEQVVHQTETARSLLECLLDESHREDPTPHRSDTQRQEVCAGRGSF